jgi:hypothetical protein
MRNASACPGRSLTTLRDAADCITALSRTEATSFQVMLVSHARRPYPQVFPKPFAVLLQEIIERLDCQGV